MKITINGNDYTGKFIKLDIALENAKQVSEQEQCVLHVIESRGAFYLDESGFIRNFETEHAVYECGKKIKA